MTTPTKLKHGSATWWVLQALRDFGAMTDKELLAMGTHETKEALASVRALHMVAKTHDGLFEIQPKGRNALRSANQERFKKHKTTKASSRTLVNAGSLTNYDGAELRPNAARPGAMDAYNLPSRICDRRVYRDGREEQVA